MRRRASNIAWAQSSMNAGPFVAILAHRGHRTRESEIVRRDHRFGTTPAAASKSAQVRRTVRANGEENRPRPSVYDRGDYAGAMVRRDQDGIVAADADEAQGKIDRHPAVPGERQSRTVQQAGHTRRPPGTERAPSDYRRRGSDRALSEPLPDQVRKPLASGQTIDGGTPAAAAALFAEIVEPCTQGGLLRIFMLSTFVARERPC
jgi:hypothetical protein